MMHQKALLFEDYEIASQIMNTTNPKKQKALGRKVEGFIKRKWDVVAKGVVYDGNYAKFSQNKDLEKELFDTIRTTLVEASPYDKIWGIGLGADDQRAKNRDTWNGTNWLGEVLTNVRNDLLHTSQTNGCMVEGELL